MLQVKDILPDDELLAQLAEEATELAQAAMKLRRAITGVNWTPKSIEECRLALIEEHSDLCCVFEQLQWNDKAEREIIKNQKRGRWLKRLLEHPHPLHKNYLKRNEETDEHL